MDGKDYAIILGAPKCGTTSIAAWLGALPDTAQPRLKETLFFTDYPSRQWSGPGAQFVAPKPIGDAAFREQFSDNPNASLRVEASTDSLSCPSALEQISTFAERDDVRSVRLIAVVRDPVSRIVSEFEHTLKLGWQTGDLKTSLSKEAQRRAENWHPLFQHTARTRYAAQLAPYRERFGDQLLILDFHELTTPETLARLASFVGRDLENALPELERRNARHVSTRPQVKKLLSNGNALTLARKFVPQGLRPGLRALVEGPSRERYVPTSEEKNMILRSLETDIAACVKDPGIPTGNWTSLKDLELAR
ncbi:MAG: sulfotransferase domain-containing protein [Dinoroseobacter sp.]|nr:sulfotransferase domain-containing protein [Dinoroseobacter sp.]MDJ0995351.1 sulfotransferase domain-containing protein [Dinoroseobacter sp.]